MIAALAIAALMLIPGEARAWTPTPLSCPAATPYYLPLGDSIVCSSSCWGLYPKPTETLSAIPGVRYAGKYCVDACRDDYAYDNDGTCVQACPAGKKPDVNKVCHLKTALDNFQEQCTGLRFAIRNDGGFPKGTYDTFLGRVEVTTPTYLGKYTEGGWLCGGQCLSGQSIEVQGDGDARCTPAAMVNLARGKSTSQSSTSSGGDAARAVDGNIDGVFGNGSVTHTNNEYQPWWQVDLQSPQAISTVILYNRTDCCSDRLNNFRVRVSNDSVTWQDYSFPGIASAISTFTINRSARFVRVQLNGTNALSLAEVQVISANLALGKPTSQSSLSSGGDAARAVDGDTNGSYFMSSVTHTDNEYQPWWQVDLQVSQAISTVVLYNRTDCCSDRLNNFRVRVSNDAVNWQDYSFPGIAPTLSTFTINRSARYVRVQLNGTNYLSLAEVQVFPVVPTVY